MPFFLVNVLIFLLLGHFKINGHFHVVAQGCGFTTHTKIQSVNGAGKFKPRL